ncbi:MAG: type IIA DNA topoisomerase subunit B, partial [Opitutae bacterium]|nr:type IIA DNA topoisomerase subunit B [Opitutae bacterium]
ADDIRLDPVKIDAHESIKEMLKFFMGKNTPERQQYIIRNLRFEVDIVDKNEEAPVDSDKKSLTSTSVVSDGEAA